ncbi:DUF190 domain-containing protein [Thiococcus pfennigii]|uniref:DUF190 domain-containing protein n=1 Tax=Thiococcus pfennigii TaxID=1057 RepID=UPI001A92AB72|nr:DUF190 domain-containing protein [Thiococcus pfennigii]
MPTDSEVTTVDGCFIRFYLHEDQRCHGRLAWEWLLEQANRLGIRGGSAFRAIGGFGRHHQLHESRFFELAGALPVQVDFIVSDAESARLLELVREAGLRAPYAHIPARFGVINPEPGEPPTEPE